MSAAAAAPSENPTTNNNNNPSCQQHQQQYQHPDNASRAVDATATASQSWMWYPSPTDWDKLYQLVDSFANQAIAQPFSEPSFDWQKASRDPKRLVVFDHPTMSLAKVRDRLQQRPRVYATFYDVFCDVQLVWRNVMDAGGMIQTNFFDAAVLLNRNWGQEYRTLLRACCDPRHQCERRRVVESRSRANKEEEHQQQQSEWIPIDYSRDCERVYILEQRALYRAMERISGADRGQLVTLVESYIPHAINRKFQDYVLEYDRLPKDFLIYLTLWCKRQKSYQIPK